MAAIHESALAHAPTETAGDQQREPQLFRFGLRQFFAFMSAAALLLGVMATLNSQWAAAVGFLVALVAAHVLATVTGTRLRNSSHAIERWTAPRLGSAVPPPRRERLTDAERAALIHGSLAHHDRAPRRTVAALAGGLVLGVTFGVVMIRALGGRELAVPELALGAVSCGVMCAWAALLASHFWVIARAAWREANAAAPGKVARRRGLFRRA